MFYKDFEIIVSEHFGSLTEAEHSVYSSNGKPFYRAATPFGVIYANTKLAARQGAVDQLDFALSKIYPV